jgi:hypothetical protein
MIPIIASNTTDVGPWTNYLKIAHRRSYKDNWVANGSLQYPVSLQIEFLNESQQHWSSLQRHYLE